MPNLGRRSWESCHNEAPWGRGICSWFLREVIEVTRGDSQTRRDFFINSFALDALAADSNRLSVSPVPRPPETASFHVPPILINE